VFVFCRNNAQQVLAFFLTYYIFANLSLLLTRADHSMAMLWLPNIIVGFMLVKTPLEKWPVFAVSIALANLAADVPFSNSLVKTTSFVTGNLVQVLIAGYFCQQHTQYKELLYKPSEFFSAMFFTCFVAPAFAGLVVVFLFYLNGDSALAANWINWMSSKVVGGLSLFGLMVCWLSIGGRTMAKKFFTPVTASIFTLAVATIYMAFTYSAEPYLLVFLVLILISIWSYFRVALVIFSMAVMLPMLTTAEHFGAQSQVSLFVYLGIVYLFSSLFGIKLHELRHKKDSYRDQSIEAISIYERTPIALHSIDDHGVLVAVSDKWLELLGYSREDVIGKKSSDFLTPASARKAIEDVLPIFFEHQKIDNVHYQFVCKDETVIDIELSAIHVEEDGVGRSYAVLEDVTREHSLADKLKAEKHLLEITVNSMGDGMVTTDEHGIITFINPVAELLTGVTYSDAVGEPFGKVVQLFDSNTGKAIFNPTELAISEKRRMGIPDTASLKSQTGDVFSVQDSVSPIIDDEGVVHGAVMVFQDVSETRAISERMSYLAQHDMLTDLPNRVLFVDRLTQACSQYNRSNEGFSILFLDLDNFKTLNDTQGHSAGDSALKHIASRITSVIRETDTVSRIGGDEFLILLEGEMNLLGTSRMCNKLIDSISEPFVLGGKSHVMTASIGVATCPKDGSDPETLMRRADAAMYRAKDLGRNRFTLYSRKYEEELHERLKVETELRLAIQENDIKLYYQPIVDAKTHKTIYAEGLSRWTNKEGDSISPIVFIKVAEETEIIHKLGESTFRQACEVLKCAQCKQSSPFRKLSVNISAKELERPDFVDDIRRILNQQSASANWFIFEITETALMLNPEQNLKTLKDLKSMGISIAIDDFGTGYSSLSYLKRFPVDIIKIDREFIRDFHVDNQDRHFVSVIVQLAKILKIKVVAEGVENSHQAEALKKIGCDYLQGFYFSKAEKFDHFTKNSFLNKAKVIDISNAYRL